MKCANVQGLQQYEFASILEVPKGITKGDEMKQIIFACLVMGASACAVGDDSVGSDGAVVGAVLDGEYSIEDLGDDSYEVHLLVDGVEYGGIVDSLGEGELVRVHEGERNVDLDGAGSLATRGLEAGPMDGPRLSPLRPYRGGSPWRDNRRAGGDMQSPWFQPGTCPQQPCATQGGVNNEITFASLADSQYQLERIVAAAVANL